MVDIRAIRNIGHGYREIRIRCETGSRTLRRHGGISGFLRQFEAKEKKDGADFTTIMVLAEAGAYSPDPAREHGIALPFDLDTGEIDWTVWQRWKAWDPVEMIAPHAEALRQMKLIFIDAGTRDEPR